MAITKVTSSVIANDAISTNQIADDAITTVKIPDNTVTLAKVAHGTQGGTIYYGASGAPTELAAGTAGQSLITAGAGANPSWSIPVGTWVLLQTISATAAEHNLTAFDNSLYDEYRVVVRRMWSDTSARILWLRTSTDGGSTYDSGAGDYSYVAQGYNTAGGTSSINSLSAAQIVFPEYLGDAETEVSFGVVSIYTPGTAKRARLQHHWSGIRYDGNGYDYTGFGLRLADADVDAVKFLLSGSGSITAEIALYGLRK